MTLTAVLDCPIPEFILECGTPLPHGNMRLWCMGPQDAIQQLEAKLSGAKAEGGSPPEVTLLVHALTGDMRAGGDSGWWGPLIGPSLPFDPSRELILCFNNLGSCYGSNGPNRRNFPRYRDVPGAPQTHPDRPAPISTWDQAKAILLALDSLGLDRIDRVVGGSIGGMIAQCVALLAPQRVSHLISVAALDRTDPWALGFNHIARQVLLDARAWRSGPKEKLALARARELAMLTYRAEEGLALRQARAPGTAWPAWQAPPIQSYLSYQGEKLVRRFTGAAYLLQLDAMDSHDIHRSPPEHDASEWSMKRLGDMRVDAVGINTDRLFHAPWISDWVAHLDDLGINAHYHEVTSPHGHDAFLIEWEQLANILTSVLFPLASNNSTVGNIA